MTVDEIVNCKLNESNQRNKNSFDSRNILSYIIYLLLLTIGITICFVDYLAIDSRMLDYRLYYSPFEGINNFTQVSVKLSNGLVLILTIFLPVLLATLHVLDKRKNFLLSITVLAILLLITFQVPIIASPGFITAEIGLMLHFTYTLFLILSLIITLSYFNIDVYRLINKNKKEFISSSVMFLLTFTLPFNYNNSFLYYFRSSDQIFFFFMLLAPCIIIYETVNGLKRFATLYYVILGITLIFSSLDNIFYSKILIVSFIQLIYILFLAISNFKKNRLNINLINVVVSKFIYIEIISLVVYLFYYIFPSSLFFSIGDDIIYTTDTSVGKFFHLNIIILLLAMIFRVANLRSVTKVFDIIWILWVTYFTQSILFDYVINPKYHASEGIFLFIPPILITLLIIINLFLQKNNNKTKLTQDMNSK